MNYSFLSKRNYLTTSCLFLGCYPVVISFKPPRCSSYYSRYIPPTTLLHRLCTLYTYMYYCQLPRRISALFGTVSGSLLGAATRNVRIEYPNLFYGFGYYIVAGLKFGRQCFVESRQILRSG